MKKKVWSKAIKDAAEYADERRHEREYGEQKEQQEIEEAAKESYPYYSGKDSQTTEYLKNAADSRREAFKAGYLAAKKKYDNQ